jgi:thiamine phosphate synthase YjbQ (UPF0047 family)
MRQAQGTLSFDTAGQGLIEVTDDVARWVAGQGVGTGMLTVYIRHTSASLVIQENADPDVMRDLETSLNIPVTDGCMALGTWQGIYLFEHRTRPHKRQLTLHLMGD